MTFKPTSSSGGGSGGTGALTLLSTTTLSVDGTLDVSGISQAYNDLILVGVIRGTRASATTDGLAIRFNNDSGNNYLDGFLTGSGVASIAWGSSALQAFGQIGGVAGATAAAGNFTNVEVVICNYASTSINKTATATAVMATGGSNSSRLDAAEVTWASTAAITRVALFGIVTANLLAGSSLRIYGRL